MREKKKEERIEGAEGGRKIPVRKWKRMVATSAQSGKPGARIAGNTAVLACILPFEVGPLPTSPDRNKKKFFSSLIDKLGDWLGLLQMETPVAVDVRDHSFQLPYSNKISYMVHVHDQNRFAVSKIGTHGLFDAVCIE